MPEVLALLDEFRVLLAAGRWSHAAPLVERIAAAARGRAEEARVWTEVGHLYAEHWRFEDSAAALARASSLDPGEPAAESIHAFVRQELGDLPGAVAALERAARRDPGDLRVAAAQRLMLPQVYEDAADVARWRERYARGLASLVAERDRWRPEQVFDLDRGNFLLAYQGEDDRDLQRGYSGLLAHLASRAAPEWRARPAARFDGTRRLRVGFVGSLFRDCTAGRYFERWVTGLDPRRFERVVYHTAPVSDAFTQRIARGADAFVPLRATIRDTAARLRADALDLLVYPEVGMDAMTYVLAALRLAPLQVAGWGHPVTTGSDAIDAYLTCAAMEPEDGASHYVEPLLQLPAIGVDYAMPEPQPPAARADFGLPEGRPLYVCAQSLFKIHPDMDALFAELLAADEAGVLVLFQATARGVTERFGARLQKALAGRGMAPRGQVKFLPRLDGAAFRRVLALGDVVLDTARWSGGNTSLDAFAAGTPVVTLPGQFMRGRQGAAMLAMMGLEELVAAHGGEYVRTALAVARDADRNRRLRSAIAERRAAIFGRAEPVAALGEALLELARKGL